MKKYIKSAFSLDVSSLSDIDDEIFDAIQQGTTKEDIEDYLIELEDLGVIDREEFKQLKSSAFDEFDRYKKTFGSVKCSEDDFVIRTPKKLDEAYLNYKSTRVSKHMPKSKQAELRKTKAGYKNEMSKLSKEYKQYIYRCVAEAPAMPDPEQDEAWSEYVRDAKEYKEWCFVDAVEDGLFEDTDADYAAFNKMWEQAETDMAQPYA